METRHRLVVGDARDLSAIADRSVQLVVTSPPYPMIEMWDEVFAALAPGFGEAIGAAEGQRAFELAHAQLDRVWNECRRVLADGGLACINIGDATRSLGGEFELFPNHARIVQGMRAAGFTVLPDILWRKPTNAPNKFMGSGMLPAGAYVTYEHEYVLVFRNGGKREFAGEAAKAVRRRSAYFWEERNLWFSDVWMDLRGTRQDLADPDTRARSAAFPFELPYRLIQMFSVQGDTVLDPFAGIGTTMVAAVASARNGIGVDREAALAPKIAAAMALAPRLGAERAEARLAAHQDFVAERARAGKKAPGHTNHRYGFPVVTGQEVDLVLSVPKSVASRGPDSWVATHADAEIGCGPAAASELPFEALAAPDGD